MELEFAQQSAAFLWSILLGAALGVIYGVLSLIRFTFKLSKYAVISLDILFMLISALSVFYFSLGFLDGYIRIYVILGAAVGFFVYRLTIGKALSRLFKPIVTVSRRIIAAILTKIKIIAKKLLKIGYNILYNIGGRIVLFFKRL